MPICEFPACFPAAAASFPVAAACFPVAVACFPTAVAGNGGARLFRFLAVLAVAGFSSRVGISVCLLFVVLTGGLVKRMLERLARVMGMLLLALAKSNSSPDTNISSISSVAAAADTLGCELSLLLALGGAMLSLWFPSCPPTNLL